LHLGGSEQELITAWKISINRLGICGTSSILLLSSSTLTSLVFLAAHLGIDALAKLEASDDAS
jgi:hypothetical protein